MAGTLAEMNTRERWRRLALCAGHPDRWTWFSDDERDANRAIAVCRVCPVRSECLTSALRRAEPSGVWGGTLPEERLHLRAG
jgi:hypothetical protein